MTHTEKVHVYFGIALALIGLTAILGTARPKSFAQTLWPILAFLLGVLLFIPVEAHTMTYHEVGWFRTLISAVPDDPGNWISNWIEKASTIHAMQHKAGGVFGMVIGAVEFQRNRGRLAGAGWGLVLPLGTMLTGIAFGVHGGSQAHLPMIEEQRHHWIMGAGFVIAGGLVLLHQRRLIRWPGWRYAWPVVMLAVGLELALFYRLPAEGIEQQRHLRHEQAAE